MSAISVTATLSIHPGKLDAFKAVTERIFHKVRGKEPGTLAYFIDVSDPSAPVVVRETYASSDAVLVHLGNVGADLGALGAFCDLSVEVFGEPSPTLLAATAAMQPKIYRPFLTI